MGHLNQFLQNLKTSELLIRENLGTWFCPIPRFLSYKVNEVLKTYTFAMNI